MTSAEHETDAESIAESVKSFPAMSKILAPTVEVDTHTEHSAGADPERIRSSDTLACGAWTTTTSQGVPLAISIYEEELAKDPAKK